MPDRPEAAFFFASEGMNGALNPVLLTPTSFARGTNVQLKHQLPTTRPGHRVIPLAGDETFRASNIQGASFYNPAKGQSAQSFGADSSSIMVAAGGQMWQLNIDDSNPGVAEGVALNVTGEGLSHDDKWHLAWIYQAERYIISQDGNGDTWIWDGSSSPEFSPGFNTSDPESSRLANGATVGVYAHGRILQVIDARKILAGDIIHGDGQSEPDNILKTTEQVYWATGSYFAPPSSMGNVVAAAILPLRNTQHGHGDVMFHCEDGVFSLDVNRFPRSSWTSQVLVRHVLLDTGARGPYAVTLYDGDQMFRSRHGIQSLRSAAGESRLEGNPLHPISEEVGVWLDKDYEPYVQFSSVAKWATQRRLFCTTGMWVEGKHRGGRGFVSLNFAPTPSQGNSAWEGLWTMTPETAYPIQLVNGVFNGRDRCFVLARGEDGSNRLAEMDQGLTADVMEDGTERPISCQFVTRVMSAQNLFSVKDNHVGTLFLKDVRGELTWGVWARPHEKANWTFWRGGRIDAQVEPTTEEESDWEFEIGGGVHPEVDLPLGAFPSKLANTRKVQFLIRWRGYCSVEGLRFKHATGDPGEDKPSQTGHQSLTFKDLEARDYDDFENATDEQRWETLIK